MGDRSTTLGLLALSMGAAVAVPVLLGSLYSVWRASAVPKPPPPPDLAALEPPPPAPEPPPPAVPPALREVDGLVFTHLESIVPEGQVVLRDIAPDRPYRVDLERGRASSKVEAVRVDLDRDGRWDERWTVAPGRVEREVSPADDGELTERYRWKGDGWAPVAASGGP